MEFQKTTPEYIYELKENEIFVFGSNIQGIHGRGAALTAKKQFGAIQGKGEGHYGQSYALPTRTFKNNKIETLSLSDIKKHVDIFIAYAWTKPYLKFYVTAVGTGLAGLSVRQIAPLFETAVLLDNVYLPKEFWEELCGI